MYTVVADFFWKFHKSLKNFYADQWKNNGKWKVNGHSPVVWYWSDDPMVPRSNPLLVKKFLLLSLLIWKGGFEILPNNTWDLLKKAYGTSKKLRFQFRGQLNKPFSEPTYLYTNLSYILMCVAAFQSCVYFLFKISLGILSIKICMQMYNHKIYLLFSQR